MANFLGALWGAYTDPAQFHQSLGQAMQTLQPDGLFCADNLLTWSRNLGFLDDAAFMAAWRLHAQGTSDQTVIWRTHVYVWCARQALRRAGDLVDCTGLPGTAARTSCDLLDWHQHKKRLYLYDLCDPLTPGAVQAQRTAQLRQRFEGLPRVHVQAAGQVSAMAQGAPRKVAFLHLSMQNAETGALAFFLDRMSPGSWIVLADYGWQGYSEPGRYVAPWLAERGLSVAELPTGQGLVLV